MGRLTLKSVSFCVLSLLVGGCVRRTSLNRAGSVSSASYMPVKPSSLTQYIRAIQKLSTENSSKQAQERDALLSQDPELSVLADRLDKNPADREALSRLIPAYMDHQLYWAAYAVLTNAQAANEDDSDINLNLARIWDVWGQYDSALQYAQRGVAMGATSAQAYEILGRIYLHRKAPAEAIEWYMRALQLGANASIQANVGYAYLLLSDWQQAKANLEKAIDLDSNIPEAHNNLAIVLSKLGDENGALAQLAKTSAPSIAFNNLGVLYMQERNTERARYFFEESLRMDPAYEIAQRNLRTIQASTPPPSIIHLPAFSAPVSAASPNTTVECTPSAESNASPAVPAAAAARAASEMELIGPTGPVETDAIPEDAQTARSHEVRGGSAAALNPARVPVTEEWERLGLSQTSVAQEEEKGLVSQAPTQTTDDSKREQTPESEQVSAPLPKPPGCTYSKPANSEHSNPSLISRLDHAHLTMAGVGGLVLTAVALALRSRKSAANAPLHIRGTKNE
jgi:tetratricopeptide (TPR) repeat protein